MDESAVDESAWLFLAKHSKMRLQILPQIESNMLPRSRMLLLLKRTVDC